MKSDKTGLTLPKSGWWILGFLTLINLFNYLDRYILVALSPTIKTDLGLSDTQVGFLATAFMLTYFAISPLFGWLGDTKPRFKVMSSGVGLWSVATVFSGIAQSFAGLLGARFAVGVGEAAYGSISPSLLTDLYPKNIRGKIFAIFFMAIPVGSALGFLLGGLLEKLVGWRHAFFVAGLPGLLLALGLLFFKEPKRGALDGEEENAPKLSAKEIYASLAKNSNYVLTVLGYCAYTFVVGGVAVWIPHYMVRYLGVEASSGNMTFGTLTVSAGFIGTMLGGAWADRWAKRGTDAYLKLSALSMFAALPVYILVLQAKNFQMFCVLVFILEFLLFLSTSPINAQIVNGVSPSIRATANAVSIFMIHLLGDAISPTLIGFISDRSNLQIAMYFFEIAILISGAFWLWKVVVEWEALPWPEGALTLPTTQCHRGYEATGEQENTLGAFRAAARAGAKMIELDVRLSADGIPVVVHDRDISRVSGKAGFVAQMSASELKKLAQVPSLKEVFQDPECANLLINVEIKSDQAASNGLELALAKVVKEVGVQGRILFSSFNPLVLRRLSRVLPDVPRALLVGSEKSAKNKFYLRKALLGFIARPHMLNLDMALYTPKMANRLKGRKVPVSIWTVADPQMAKNFLAMGAESIISPEPEIL